MYCPALLQRRAQIGSNGLLLLIELTVHLLQPCQQLAPLYRCCIWGGESRHGEVESLAGRQLCWNGGSDGLKTPGSCLSPKGLQQVRLPQVVSIPLGFLTGGEGAVIQWQSTRLTSSKPPSPFPSTSNQGYKRPLPDTWELVPDH